MRSSKYGLFVSTTDDWARAPFPLSCRVTHEQTERRAHVLLLPNIALSTAKSWPDRLSDFDHAYQLRQGILVFYAKFSGPAVRHHLHRNSSRISIHSPSTSALPAGGGFQQQRHAAGWSPKYITTTSTPPGPIHAQSVGHQMPGLPSMYDETYGHCPSSRSYTTELKENQTFHQLSSR